MINIKTALYNAKEMLTKQYKNIKQIWVKNSQKTNQNSMNISRIFLNNNNNNQRHYLKMIIISGTVLRKN